MMIYKVPPFSPVNLLIRRNLLERSETPARRFFNNVEIFFADLRLRFKRPQSSKKEKNGGRRKRRQMVKQMSEDG